MNTAHRERATEDEYLIREKTNLEKHEYVNGEIVDMVGSTPEHAQITANVTIAVGALLRGRPCRTYSSDLRVHVESTGLYTYPDLTVVCGDLKWHANQSGTLLNPTLLVEVLSDSTEAYDRGAKFGHYQRMASLQEYVLVSQTERRVEVFRRAEAGVWTYHEHRDGVVPLGSLGVEVPLSEIYERVALPD